MDDPRDEEELTVRILEAHLLTGPRPGQCETSHNKHVDLAHAVLSAALAGRTVVELPALEQDDEGVRSVWVLGIPLIVSAYVTADGPVVDMGHLFFDVKHARAVAAAIIAVADPFPAESDQDGEPNA